MRHPLPSRTASLSVSCLLLAAFALATGPGCGGGSRPHLSSAGDTGPNANDPLPDGGDAGSPPPPPQALLPLEIGRRWTYRVTDPVAGTRTKQTEVVDLREMDGAKQGVQAYVVETRSLGMRSVIFVEERSDFALRHREDHYAGTQLAQSTLLLPASLRGPEAMPQAGARWNEQYTQEVYDASGTLRSSQVEAYTWEVESVSAPVSVPAGNFSAVQLLRTRLGSGKTKRTWWVPGVGKVREDDNGTIEELTGHQAP